VVDELATLVPAACAGEARAVEQLLGHLRPGIVRYCRGRLGRTDGSYGSADDVAQEVCMAVVKALPRYVDTGTPFAAFVHGITVHKVSDAQRALYRDRTTATEHVPERADEAAGPEEALLAGERATVARALLERLPAAHREPAPAARRRRDERRADRRRARHERRCRARRTAPCPGPPADARRRQ
jgi:RNA polymerase sigma-70 factor (ECF subfamily)